MGHLNNVGVCLDLGHAHITVGTAEAIATLGSRIASVHVHDNHGMKDEHLWPGDGTIDWPAPRSAQGARHAAGDRSRNQLHAFPKLTPRCRAGLKSIRAFRLIR